LESGFGEFEGGAGSSAVVRGLGVETVWGSGGGQWGGRLGGGGKEETAVGREGAETERLERAGWRGEAEEGHLHIALVYSVITDFLKVGKKRNSSMGKATFHLYSHTDCLLILAKFR